jgi:hypothetical protein
MKNTHKKRKKNLTLMQLRVKLRWEKKQIHKICYLKKEKKRKREEDIPERGGEDKESRREEKRREEKERDFDVFYIRGRRRRRKRGLFVMKWGILVFLLGHFTDG